MKKLFSALKEVYTKKKYFIFTILFSLFIFSTNTIIRNYKILLTDFSLKLFFSLIKGSYSSMSLLSFGFLIMISILSGIVFSLSLFLIKRQLSGNLGIGASGIITGILAPACPSCALGGLGVLGLGGFLTFLPFKGKELGVLGLLLLLFSINYLCNKITTKTCIIK